MCPRTHNSNEAVVDADTALRATGQRKWLCPHAHTKEHILLLPLETGVPLLQRERALLTALCLAVFSLTKYNSALGVLNSWEKLCVPL